MKNVQGVPLPLGTTIQENQINFSVSIPKGKSCNLLLYQAGETKVSAEYEMEKQEGSIWAIALEGIEPDQYEYNYRVDGRIVVDPYVKALAGKEVWGVESTAQKHEIRGKLTVPSFEWGEDAPLQIPQCEVVAYSLHVRGFTKNPHSGVCHDGTFEGVIEKIPYLLELGVNQIQCMMIYDFEETGKKCNYWGYGDAYYFAPKNGYSANGDGSKSLKKMIRACHEAGIEVVLQMAFSDTAPKTMMVDCLRYYRMEYHVDGFLLNPTVTPMDLVLSDPVLQTTKVLYYQTDFQNDMRRFLKGDEGMIPGVCFWLRHVAAHSFNFITTHSGFTLYDLVSYNAKHNEENLEENRDGIGENFSWNCGEEGETEVDEVKRLRKRQMYNALFLLLLSEGTPCILAGDEFANTQMGNNNVYCQDNEIGWLNWEKLSEEKELFEFVKMLIRIRKEQLSLYENISELKASFHGAEGWKVQEERTSRQLGILYENPNGHACYIACNMHWLEHELALPNLSEQREWWMIASTEEGILSVPKKMPRKKTMKMKPRTIVVLTEGV